MVSKSWKSVGYVSIVCGEWFGKLGGGFTAGDGWRARSVAVGRGNGSDDCVDVAVALGGSIRIV